MKKGFFVAMSLLVISILSGCSNYDEEAEELIEYYNGWLAIQEDEDDSLESMFFSFAMASDETRMTELIVEDLRPYYRESLEYLEQVELEKEDVQQLKQLQIDADKFALELFNELGGALNRTGGDIDAVLNTFEQDFNELDEKMDEFLAERNRLMNKYDVHWIIDYDEDGNELEILGRDR